MKKEQLFNEIGKIDDSLVTEADKQVSFTPRLKKWAAIGAAVACACVVLGFGISSIIMRNGGSIAAKKIQLPSSDGVRAKYIDKSPEEAKQALDLVSLTEDELFTEFNTAVFKGEVVAIKNIQLNFNGEKDYVAVTSIRIDKVYRGGISQGETVDVLLPCAIDDGVWVEDTETVSAMRVGTVGIFMPTIYDESSYYETNGARLVLTDLAPLGFADGVRYAFLETDGGLVFSDWAYPSLENAQTLDDVEQFVTDMIEKTK